jgi:hypothetical protein
LRTEGTGEPRAYWHGNVHNGLVTSVKSGDQWLDVFTSRLGNGRVANTGRPHMAPGPGVPDPRPANIDHPHSNSRHRRGEPYAVRATPILGGLHPEYSLVVPAAAWSNFRGLQVMRPTDRSDFPAAAWLLISGLAGLVGVRRSGRCQRTLFA